MRGVSQTTILISLDRTEVQRDQAAKLMGISRSSLYRRPESLKINPNDALDNPIDWWNDGATEPPV